MFSRSAASPAGRDHVHARDPALAPVYWRRERNAMPCDAVAVAGAQVAEEHLRQYLTPATLTAPLTAYLAARFLQAQIAYQTWGEEVVWTVVAGGQTQTIRVRAAQVTITLDTGHQAAANPLATELQQALTAIAAAY